MYVILILGGSELPVRCYEKQVRSYYFPWMGQIHS
jgi:hypothetical protein